jgi:hypothetical protein
MHNFVTKYLTISFAAHHVAILMKKLGCGEAPAKQEEKKVKKQSIPLGEKVLGDMYNLTKSAHYCSKTKTRPYAQGANVPKERNAFNTPVPHLTASIVSAIPPKRITSNKLKLLQRMFRTKVQPVDLVHGIVDQFATDLPL